MNVSLITKLPNIKGIAMLRAMYIFPTNGRSLSFQLYNIAAKLNKNEIIKQLKLIKYEMIIDKVIEKIENYSATFGLIVPFTRGLSVLLLSLSVSMSK